ncbi:HNH endonuclease [Leifsonia sp. ZF2019]|uniref:HNH endonuclease n=1 Tax=Leifsonia sp. ZF2019 TaxID=2781978 RepID=UPI001CBC287D|nr:HNH endonuclease [Leifsonia sp. ZF2019]UAJ78343.1 HNH endonuclease [Leifsonia sp. ZF2019]
MTAVRKHEFARRLDLRNAPEPLKDRFWSKVNIGDPDECWEWTAHRKVTGYGQFTLRKGVFLTASRVSLALSGVVLEPGVVACHKCDNPPCVNPSHLFAGTQRANTFDCVEKGRGNRSHGVAHRSAKLTPDDVRAIRSEPIGFGTRTLLAQRYGVSLSSIKKVLAYSTWRDVA